MANKPTVSKNSCKSAKKSNNRCNKKCQNHINIDLKELKKTTLSQYLVSKKYKQKFHKKPKKLCAPAFVSNYAQSNRTYPNIPYTNIPTDLAWLVTGCKDKGAEVDQKVEKKKDGFGKKWLFDLFNLYNDVAGTNEHNLHNPYFFDECGNVIFGSFQCQEDMKEYLRRFLKKNKSGNMLKKMRLLKKNRTKIFSEKDCDELYDAAQQANLFSYTCDDLGRLLRDKDGAGNGGVDQDEGLTLLDYMKKYGDKNRNLDDENNNDLWKVLQGNPDDLDKHKKRDRFGQSMDDFDLWRYNNRGSGDRHGNKHHHHRRYQKRLKNDMRIQRSTSYLPILYHSPFDRRDSATFKKRHPRQLRLIGSHIRTGGIENYDQLVKNPHWAKYNPYARHSVVFGTHTLGQNI